MIEPTSGWHVHKLGDVVENVNEYYDRSSTEPERYVAGDHIDEGSLSVRRWGLTSDDAFPPTFNRRFRAGDVLFHSRNLRKLAQPTFDGITGEKLFVLRVHRPDLLVPALLPFLLQTAHFDGYVNRMWAGSTNKFLNKTPLMRYEFRLPSPDTQQHATTVLAAAEMGRRKHRLLVDALITLERSVVAGVDTRASRVALGEVIVSSDYGSSARSNRERKGSPILGIPNVLRGELDLSDLNWSDLSEKETGKYRLREGDVLVVRTNGNPDYVGRCLAMPALEQTTVFASYLIRLVPDISRIRPRFLAAMLNSDSVSRVLRRHVRSSAGNYNMNTEGLRATPIPLPPLDEQDALLGRLSALRALASKSGSRAAALQELQRQVLVGWEE